ncbi:MAG TPA: hypothetical protein VGP91_05340 [Actinoplanes sp.]|nr:hypothetical protein [Actinoplanes sp.]
MPSAGQTITAAAANAIGIPVAPTTTSSNGTATSAGTETRDAVLGNYQFTAVAGVRYKAIISGRAPNGSVANDRYAVGLRYTVGGATPTSSSTLIGHASSGVVVVSGGNGVASIYHDGTFIPGAGVITICSFWTRLNGTGIITPTGICEMYVQGIGYV